LLSAALILIPLVDAFTTLYPWNVGDARWRFGAVGLVSNAVLLPLLGLLLAYITALWFNQRTMRRVIGVLSFVGAGIALLAIVMFGLDAVQTRASVRDELHLSFAVASVTAALKTLIAAATLLGLGVAARRGPNSTRAKNQSVAPLIVAEPGRTTT
jgi:hypothetical protein